MYINSPKFQQSWWHSRLIKSDQVVYSLHVNVAGAYHGSDGSDFGKKCNK